VRAEVEAVTGKDFSDFFRRYISGTDEIPYNNFLAIAGLELKSVPNSNPHFAVREMAHPTERQRRVLEGVLHGTTN
jgi:predicted metalloprotease with PDZ domain